MSRRGSFGQVPRVQPSLTSTIIALAREMQSQQDQNLMSAWKNGGVFEGKPATDERVLAYWNERMQGLDKQDPLYESYKDQVFQLTYGIEQSRADLAHVQGKLSDTQYAQFFLKWAGKVPKNSEWWRTLQKDAAQLMESAKAKSKAASDKAKVESYNAFVKGQQGDIDVGNALLNAINELSSATRLTVAGNGEELLSLLTQDYANQPGKYRALTDALKQNDPGFSGIFDTDFFARSLDNAEDAYGRVATRSNKDGYASNYSSAAAGQAKMTEAGSNMHVWPVAKMYDKVYKQFASVLDNPGASAMDKKAAAARFSATATLLSQRPDIDVGTATMLAADAARAIGQDAGDSPSFGATILGHPGITPEIQMAVATQTMAEELMAQNPGAFVYAPVDSKGAFDKTGEGAIGIVPAGAVPAGSVSIPVTGLDGTARMVSVQPKWVTVVDPNDPNAKPQTIGRTISWKVGGQTLTMYNYGSAAGDRWTTTSPYAAGVRGAVDGDGALVLTLPLRPTDPMATAMALDPSGGLARQMSTVGATNATFTTTEHDANGKAIGKRTVTWNGTSFLTKLTEYTYDTDGKQIEGASVDVPTAINTPESLATSAVAASLISAGDVPGVTFTSPLAAAADLAETHMSGAQVSALAKSPEFQDAFVTQTLSTLGITDASDPRVEQAWHDVTARARSADVNAATGFVTNQAQMREDLTYPGAPAPQEVQDWMKISFGGQTLKLPAVPKPPAQQYPLSPLSGPNGASQTPQLSYLGQALPPSRAAVPTGSGVSFTPVNTVSGFTPAKLTATNPTPMPTPLVTPPPSTVNPFTGFTVAPTTPPVPRTGWGGR